MLFGMEIISPLMVILYSDKAQKSIGGAAQYYGLKLAATHGG